MLYNVDCATYQPYSDLESVGMDLTLSQVAKELGYKSTSTLRKHIAEGKLKAHKPGHDWLVKRKDLDAYKAAMEQAGNAGWQRGQPRKNAEEA